MIQLEHSYYAPIAYKDEHYLSYLFRWAALGGVRTLSQGLTALIGSAPIFLYKALNPEFVLRLVKGLPAEINRDTFLLDHTQERYFKYIKSDPEADKGNNTKRYFVVGKKALGDFTTHHLRWCPACAKDDDRQYGITYWHNSHQDSRLLRCQRHGLNLLSTCELCKRKKVYLTQLSMPPTAAVCQYCRKPLADKCNKQLTEFHCWLESLHHLSYYDVFLNREGFVQHITKLVDEELKSMPSIRVKNAEGPQRRFVEMFNQFEVGQQIGTGAVPYEALNHYTQLRLNYLLNIDIYVLPELYALMGWVFLSYEQRIAHFGIFRGGRAIQVNV
jgi:hypothetical protein